MKETPTLLLVHGAWHGPWCWDRLIPQLHRLGLDTATVALPSVGDDPARLGGVADDARAIEAAAEAIPGDVVVLAHSYGGIPATEARLPDNVKHIVYLGAFLPDIGQSLVNLLPPGPLPPFIEGRPDDTTAVIPEHAMAAFYADVDPATAQWAIGQLRPHNGLCNVTPLTYASWRELPSTYILLTEDFACPTIVQRQTHQRCTRTIEMSGCHSPFLSKPAELAAVLAGIIADARQPA